jgi:hypothetical protein
MVNYQDFNVPEGHWIALASDGRTVVAHGTDLNETLAAAKDRGESYPVITSQPLANQALIL